MSDNDKKKVNYVDNKKLLEVLTVYRKQYLSFKDGKIERPRIPEYVGKAVLEIANRVASRPNFYGYTYKEEMVSDAILNAIQYIHNFNPEKSQNPYGYLTQIVFYAFFKRISVEKKQSNIRIEMLKGNDLFDFPGAENMDISKLEEMAAGFAYRGASGSEEHD